MSNDQPAEMPFARVVEFHVLCYIAQTGLDGFSKLETLTTSHFYDYSYSQIFAGWCKLIEDNQAIDFASLVSHPENKRNITGSILAIASGIYSGMYSDEKGEPVHGVPIPTEPIDYYCEILEEHRQLRAFITACNKAAAKARWMEKPVHELKQMLYSDLSNTETRKNESLTEISIARLNRMIEDRERGDVAGIKTGVEGWDSALGGILPARFYVLGARPKVGKSALVEQIMQNQIEAGHAVLIFQRDMSVQMMIGRMACRKCGVVFEDFEKGLLSSDALMQIRLAAEEINPKLLRIHSPLNMTGAEMVSIIHREIKQSKIEVFYCDLFQRLQHHGRDKVEGFVDDANAIRGVIQDTGISGVIIAEVNKEAAKTVRPNSSQFKYCDGLFSNCDTSAFLWTDDDAHQEELNTGKRRQQIKFTVDANRGGVGEETLYFDRPHMTFYDSAV